MARSMTADEVRKLIDLKREYMNDWDAEEIEINYDSAAGKLVDEFEDVYTSKSTRMLIQALEALESTGGLDFAVLKYPDLGETWSKYTRRREEKRKRAQALEKLKSTFSKEEMQLLGINNLVK